MRLLLFDFDGVLADTFADMLLFAQQACDELGVPHTVTPSDLCDLDVMSFATFGQACEVPDKLVGEFVSKCTDRFAQKKTPPAIFDGLPHVVRKLSEENILVIVTGNTVGNVNAFLAHHGLTDCFRKIYGVDMAGSKAEKIKMAIKQFETGKESAFLIGDSLSDIRAAREADIRSVAVGWGHQRWELLVREEPHLIVHSPLELLYVLG